jgi:hypothetical protein
MRQIIALATLALSAAPALAGDPPLPLTYEAFEASVPHINLADCPAALAAEGRFCRLTLAQDQLSIFAFSEEGDQPMVAVKSWPADGLTAILN